MILWLFPIVILIMLRPLFYTIYIEYKCKRNGGHFYKKVWNNPDMTSIDKVCTEWGHRIEKLKLSSSAH